MAKATRIEQDDDSLPIDDETPTTTAVAPKPATKQPEPVTVNGWTVSPLVKGAGDMLVIRAQKGDALHEVRCPVLIPGKGAGRFAAQLGELLKAVANG